MTHNALLQSLTAERYTPPEMAQAVQELYPGGFYDLASCDLANQVMGATGFFTRDDDTLSREILIEDAFCNPPGGKVGGRSLQKAFWQYCHRAYLEGRIRSLVFLCFNLNSGPALCPEMLRYPMVFTSHQATSPCVNSSGRVKFLASLEELRAVIARQVELAKISIEAAERKLLEISKLPIAVPGTDLVQERAPTNPGLIVFLPPRDLHLIGEDFRFELLFKQFGTPVIPGQG